ncbi:T9SS type A sorting domain-containing protein [Candidatus Poribacteria bacterium]|nr:T9SS type A sorting domain-containing protein [Candidatus Poribacteria bacterium]
MFIKRTHGFKICIIGGKKMNNPKGKISAIMVCATIICSIFLSFMVLVSAVDAADDWTQKFPDPHPSARRNHAMAYISRNRVLLFGGYGASSTYDDTWVYYLSDNTWTPKTLSPHPSARGSHAMAYIGGDKVLLFGGYDGFNNYNDTWVYDLSDDAWTQQNPSSKPSARRAPAMAYIGGDKVLLFGGGITSVYNDTWVYDLSDDAWTQQNPSSKPSARHSSSMAYIGGDKALLFGGWTNSGFRNDTWIYDLNDNTWTQDVNTTQPSARFAHRLSETSMDGTSYLVLFGGEEAGAVKDDDTWTFGGGDYLSGATIAIRTDKLTYHKGDSMTVCADVVNNLDRDFPDALLALYLVTVSRVLPVQKIPFEMPADYEIYDWQVFTIPSLPSLRPGSYAYLGVLASQSKGILDAEIVIWTFSTSLSATEAARLRQVAEEYVRNLTVADLNDTRMVGLSDITSEVSLKPAEPRLFQNTPNPFNPETWIPFQLKEGTDVTIRIFNVAGQLVRMLELGHKEAGFYINKERAAYWDGKNDTGQAVSSGVYFYHLSAGDFSATRKMVIVK